MGFRQNQARHVYYDPVSGREVPKGSAPGLICFDSASEYNCYRMLRGLFLGCPISIELQPKLVYGQISWKVDFRLFAYDSSTRRLFANIQRLFYPQSPCEDLSYLHVEYKGYKDKNFQDKFGTLVKSSPNFAKTVILLSGTADGYTHIDTSSRKFYVHPIFPVDTFRLWGYSEVARYKEDPKEYR